MLHVRHAALPAPAPRPLARILVSDDDPAIRALYATLLNDHGFEVHSAPSGDGRITLDLALRVRPHLLLTDRHKPGLDGEALRAALRANPATAHLPILMVSTLDPWGVPLAAAGPRDDFLLKPFPVEHLIYRLAALLPLTTADHDYLATRARRLPCYEHSHPVTGLPCLHSMARRLGPATSAPGWAALGAGLVGFSGLVRAVGRPDAEGLLAHLGAIMAAVAGPGLLAAHAGFDPQIVLVGPKAAVDAAGAQILARFAAVQQRAARLRPAMAPPRLCLRRADSAAGLTLGLPALRAALVVR
jgi:CheY-like chemotaxis protein